MDGLTLEGRPSAIPERDPANARGLADSGNRISVTTDPNEPATSLLHQLANWLLGLPRRRWPAFTRSWVGRRLRSPAMQRPTYRPQLVALEERALPGESVGGVILAGAPFLQPSEARVGQLTQPPILVQSGVGSDRSSEPTTGTPAPPTVAGPTGAEAAEKAESSGGQADKEAADETTPDDPKQAQGKDPLDQVWQLWDSFNSDKFSGWFDAPATKGREQSSDPERTSGDGGGVSPADAVSPAAPLDEPSAGSGREGNAPNSDGDPGSPVPSPTQLAPPSFTSSATPANTLIPSTGNSNSALPPSASAASSLNAPAGNGITGQSGAAPGTSSRGSLTSSPDPTFPFVVGVSSTYPLATFTDPNQPGSYSTSIDWGDGNQSSGSITVSNNGTTFAVYGTHTYADVGTFPIATTFTDPNGSLTVTDSAAVTAVVAPTITSAATATVTAGSASSFTITTGGSLTPTLSETGALPSGVSFSDNNNGTATLNWTSYVVNTGNYNLTMRSRVAT